MNNKSSTPMLGRLFGLCIVLAIAGCQNGGGGHSGPSGNNDTPGNPHPNSGNTNNTSGGALRLDVLRVSRTECTSPCPVIFSIDDVQDDTAVNPFTDTGIYWDYDDDQADNRDGRFEKGAQYFLSGYTPNGGASRETDQNAPLGMHTYHCDQATCTYYPAVSLQNAQGDWVKSVTTITVHAANETFDVEHTVCYSSSGNFDGCPDGATMMISSTLPLLEEWVSNTRYLLRRGDVFASAESDPTRMCMGYDKENIQVAAFGPGDAKAELSAAFGIGADHACNDLVVNDAQALAYSVPFWNQNITLTDLRLPEVRLGMSFENITLHQLDMDYEDSLTGGGRVIMENGNYCSNSNDLDCANVPLPKGLYFSSLTIIGSRYVPPGINIGLLPYSCVSFIGFIDITLQVAFEHNLRVECSSRVVVMHSDINGDHIGTNGNKHGITLRPEGYYAGDMLLEGVRRSATNADGGRANVYEDRYVSIKDVYLGTPESVNNASRISIAPSNALTSEVTRYALVSGSVTDMSGGSGDGPANRDVNFAGWGLTCYDDNVWETVNGCGDGGQGSVPDGGYELPRTISAPMIPPAPDQLP